jgi:hypothetical protein
MCLSELVQATTSLGGTVGQMATMEEYMKDLHKHDIFVYFSWEWGPFHA